MARKVVIQRELKAATEAPIRPASRFDAGTPGWRDVAAMALVLVAILALGVLTWIARSVSVSI